MNDTERIKDAINLVDVVGRYITLERAGRNFRACCPFHQEKTPSFFVSEEKQYWHCYGACGEGGDVFSFLMKIENLEFFPALQRLAALAGLELQSTHRKSQPHPHAPLYRLMAQAATFYRQQFLDRPEAQVARNYMQERGITLDTLDRFQLGYSSRSGQSLVSFMRQQQADLDRLVKIGLLFRDDDTQRYTDRFRGRLMIPIQDRQGRVIGFGARILGGASSNAPKYINSATTPLFQKKQVLFGIDKALDSIRRSQQAVLVEGYMDVITAHQHGFPNTVACMGTAITPEQLEILRRYTPRIVFALDADAAGQQATLRGLARARSAMHQGNLRSVRSSQTRKRELQLSIVTLPSGQDPDELIRTNRDTWRELLKRSHSLVDFYVNYVASHQDLSRPEEKQEAVDLLVEVLAEIEQEIVRDEYTKRVAKRFETSEKILSDLVNQKRAQMRNQPKPSTANARVALPDTRSLTSETPPPRREDFLLGVLFKHPESVRYNLNTKLDGYGLTNVQVDDFQHAPNRELFVALEKILMQGDAWDRGSFLESLSEPLAHHMMDIEKFTYPLQDNTRQEISHAAAETLVQIRRETVDIQIEMVSLQSTGGTEIVARDSQTKLNRKRQYLYQQRERLDRVRKQLNVNRHTWAEV